MSRRVPLLGENGSEVKAQPKNLPSRHNPKLHVLLCPMVEKQIRFLFTIPVKFKDGHLVHQEPICLMQIKYIEDRITYKHIELKLSIDDLEILSEEADLALMKINLLVERDVE